MDVYKQIKNNTLVDIYRCYELWELLLQTKKCAEGGILEVGVWRGGTAALLASAAKLFKIQEEIYLFDTFKGVVKTSEKDDLFFYHDGKHNDTSEEIVKSLLNNMKLDNIKLFKGVFPDDLDNSFSNKKWRFVHIDVDIYKSAKDVFYYVWEKVQRGGCVVFDDYGFISTKGVTRLLNEIKNLISDGLFFYNVNGHGVFIKI